MNSSTRTCLVAHDGLRHRRTPVRLLAIDPNSRGFGFVLFENTNLIDWGLANVPAQNRNAQCIRRLARMLQKYGPDRLIVEDLNAKGVKRRERIHRLVDEVSAEAQRIGVPTTRIKWPRAAQYFSDSRQITKLEVAQGIAELFPELKRLLPRKRRCWDSQDPRLSIFNSAALTIAFICMHLARRSEPRA